MEHILKWFTDRGDGKALTYVLWFQVTFKPNDFQGLDALFACFIMYCAELGVIPCYRFLETYLKVDGMHDVKKYNIKLDDMDNYDYDQLSQLMEAFDVIKQVSLSTYDLWMNEDLTDRNFRVDMHEFMKETKSGKITNAIMRALPNLSNGSDINDVSQTLRHSLVNIDETYSLDKLNDIDATASEVEEQKMELITTTGIHAIDGDIGGIYTHLIYTINAQPSGGKTRLALVHFIYRTLVLAKKNIILYETELTKTQVKNILIAYHITQLFSKKVPDSTINKGNLSPEQQSMYDTAKADLFESGKYGQLHILDECVVETLEDETTAIIRSDGNIAMICIDYMGLIESRPTGQYKQRLQGYEIITESYKLVRKLVKRYDMAAVCINQFNEQGIDAAYAGKTIKSGYVQGGHIVNRHTDYDLSLTYTEEQKLAGMRTLSNTKTRGTEGFKPVQLRVELSVSQFLQEVKQ